MRRLPRSLFLLLASVIPLAAAAQSSTVYALTWEATWSPQTHPEAFPEGPHFSPLIGATHSSSAEIWRPGALASPGIESMAETGATSILQSEIGALQTAGTANSLIVGGSVNGSPGTATRNFAVDRDHPLVTLVSMLAPSPDWFVGVHGLSLLQNGEWISEISVPLELYDAGTDSGPSYISPNQDTSPPEQIGEITGFPVSVNGQFVPVGTFRFVRLGTSSSDGGPEERVGLTAPFPNPASHTTELTLRIAAAGPIDVRVFDVLGREVETLISARMPAGVHPFRLDVSSYAPGVYVVRSRTAERTDLRRVVVR